MVNIAILGYGNLGRAVEELINDDDTLNLVGVFSRRKLQHEKYYDASTIGEYADKIDVVVVHSYEEYGINIPDWIEKNFPSDAGYIHCRDAEGDLLFRSYGGTDAWPITVILDENGVIQYNVEGSTTYEEMSAVIDKLLAD